MPCHPPFPLMEFWSLKPPRSRQEEEKNFPDPTFFIYLYTFSMFVECTDPRRWPGLLSRQFKFLTFAPIGCSLC